MLVAGAWLESAATPAHDMPTKADAIIVLGGDTGHRTTKAYELFQEGVAPTIVAYRMRDRAPGAALAGKSLLLQKGVDEHAIIEDERPKSTWEEAKVTRELMDKHGWHSVIVISDPPHMQRLSMAWSKVTRGTELQFALVAAEPGWWKPWTWWESVHSRSLVLHELYKLLGFKVAIELDLQKSE